MQKILKYVYLKSQTPHRHAKPEGFVYFQFIGKPINGTKEMTCLCCMLNLGHLCACFCFTSLLFGQDFKFICSNLYSRPTQAKFSFASKSPPRVMEIEFMYHFT